MNKLLPVVYLFIAGTALGQKKQTTPLQLDAIWSGQYDQKDISPQLLNTKPAVAFIRADKATNFEGILTLDMVTGKIIDTLFTNQTKVQQGDVPITFTFFEDFTFSPDDTKILIRTEKQSIYHTSHKEFVFVWDDIKKTLKPVSTDGKISAAQFSPNGNYISFVRDANLYVRNIATDKIAAITSDGNNGSIINGIADEVYEDGFGMHTAYAWNSKSNKIAYLKINQGFVRKVPLINYEKSDANVQQRIYAKAGESISEATLYVYDIEKNNTTKIFLGDNTNQYITNFKWTIDGTSLLIERLARSQQKLDLLLCNANNGKLVKIVLTEEAKPYIRNNPNNIYPNQDGKSFLWLSEQSGYNHIYNINLETNIKTQITNGNWEVHTIEAVDALNETIYYSSNQANVMEKHLYKINYTDKKIRPVKLTVGNAWHDVLISKDNSYFFDKAATINTPYVYNIYKTSGKEITNKALIENRRFKELIDTTNFKNAKTFQFNNSKNISLHGWVIDANNKTKSGAKPLLMYVYGSNGKQETTQEWNNRMAMTFRYFSNLGYVVACVDPRGAAGKGAAFRNASSADQFALNAIADIEETKNYLARNYNIDKKRTTLMGWSYGGYLTALSATKYGGNFSKYIAIAPVTSWQDYNAPFTERILGLPSDNFEAYKYAKPEEHIDGYKGGLLLVHGTSDDNVHVQHSLKLAKVLTESDYYYDIQIFTDKGHSLSDGQVDKTRMNLFRKIEKFLQVTIAD